MLCSGAVAKARFISVQCLVRITKRVCAGRWIPSLVRTRRKGARFDTSRRSSPSFRSRTIANVILESGCLMERSSHSTEVSRSISRLSPFQTRRSQSLDTHGPSFQSWRHWSQPDPPMRSIVRRVRVLGRPDMGSRRLSFPAIAVVSDGCFPTVGSRRVETDSDLGVNGRRPACLRWANRISATRTKDWMHVRSCLR